MKASSPKQDLLSLKQSLNSGKLGSALSSHLFLGKERRAVKRSNQRSIFVALAVLVMFAAGQRRGQQTTDGDRSELAMAWPAPQSDNHVAGIDGTTFTACSVSTTTGERLGGKSFAGGSRKT
jgi:hypothetical protein